jgi:copper homeostasis protein
MNYYYSADEWEIIKEDIRMCKELGCDGISVGAQRVDGTIDINRMREIVDLAYPLKVTCNRAFDAVPDPFEALETLISVGCERILTSGLAATAPEGASLLAQLVSKALGRISIMPGAGVRSHNLQDLIDTTGATEYHSSARMNISNPMSFANPRVTDSGNFYVADEDELRKMIATLRQRF